MAQVEMIRQSGCLLWSFYLKSVDTAFALKSMRKDNPTPTEGSFRGSSQVTTRGKVLFDGEPGVRLLEAQISFGHDSTSLLLSFLELAWRSPKAFLSDCWKQGTSVFPASGLCFISG